MFSDGAFDKNSFGWGFKENMRVRLAFRYRLFIVLHFIFSAGVLFGQAESGDSTWFKIKTEHFEYLYQDEGREVAYQLLSYGEEIYRALSEVFDNDPGPVTVKIDSDKHFRNASVGGVPLRVTVYPAPPNAPMPGPSHLLIMFTHELVHYFQLKVPRSKNGDFSEIGNPVAFVSRGFWEGTATALETFLSTGGRGRNPIFEMLYTGMLYSGVMPGYGQTRYSIGLVPQGREYVLGYVLMSYLIETYGLEKLSLFNQKVIKFPFQGEQRYAPNWEEKKDFEQLWEDALDDLRQKYQRQFALSGGESIFSAGYIAQQMDSWLGASDEAPRESVRNVDHWYQVQNTARGIFALRNQGNYTEIGLLERDPEGVTGFQVLHQFTSGYLAENQDYSVTADGDIAVFSAVQEINGTRYKRLYKLKVPTGEVSRLDKGDYLYHPAISDDGRFLVAVERYQSIYSRLVQVDLNTGETSPLYSEPGSNFYYPDFSPDGTQLVFVRSFDMIKGNGQSGGIARLTLSESEGLLSVEDVDGLVEDDMLKLFPRYTPSGSILYASDWAAEGTLGVSQLYELKPDTQEVRLLIEDPVGALRGELIETGGETQVWYTSHRGLSYQLRRKPYLPKPLPPLGKVSQKPPRLFGERLPLGHTKLSRMEKILWDAPLSLYWIPDTFYEFSSLSDWFFGFWLGAKGKNQTERHFWKADISELSEKSFLGDFSYTFQWDWGRVSYSLGRNIWCKSFRLNPIIATDHKVNVQFSSGFFNGGVDRVGHRIDFGVSGLWRTLDGRMLKRDDVLGKLSFSWQSLYNRYRGRNQVLYGLGGVILTSNLIVVMPVGSTRISEFRTEHSLSGLFPLFEDGVLWSIQNQLVYHSLEARNQKAFTTWHRTAFSLPIEILDWHFLNLGVRELGLRFSVGTSLNWIDQVEWSRKLLYQLVFDGIFLFNGGIRFQLSLGVLMLSQLDTNKVVFEPYFQIVFFR